jgi:hypothetical protein
MYLTLNSIIALNEMNAQLAELKPQKIFDAKRLLVR